jgi:hypothetical protein
LTYVKSSDILYFKLSHFSIVGVATGWMVQGSVLVGARSFSFLQQVQTGANLASCSMGIRFLSQHKAPGAWHWPLVGWKWVSLYLQPPYKPSWFGQEQLYFTISHSFSLLSFVTPHFFHIVFVTYLLNGIEVEQCRVTQKSVNWLVKCTLKYIVNFFIIYGIYNWTCIYRHGSGVADLYTICVADLYQY